MTSSSSIDADRLDRLQEAVRTGTLNDVQARVRELECDGPIASATALQAAVRTAFKKRGHNKDQDDQLLLYLLRQPGVDVNEPDPQQFQRTPFLQAVLQQRVAVVEYLLQREEQEQPAVDLNVAESTGTTALHYTCTRAVGYKIARLLLQSGPQPGTRKFQNLNVNATTKIARKTPLHLAVRDSRTQLVQWLLQQPDIQVNCQDCEGNTALHLAVVQAPRQTNRDSWNKVRLLLRHPSLDLLLYNKRGETVLHLLIAHQAPEDILEQFLKALPKPKEGSEKRQQIINQRNNHGNTPLELALAWPFKGSDQSREKHIASQRHQCAVVECLLQQPSIDINSQTLRKGNTALQGHILTCSVIAPVDTLRQVLEHPQWDPRMVNDDGFNTLHMAFRHLYDQSLPFVQTLVHCYHDNLINCGSPHNGRTALHYAVAYYEDPSVSSKKAMLSTLLQHSHINVNAPDHYGNTPLHTAVRSRQKLAGEAVEMLLNHPEIQISICNMAGKSPTDVAHSKKVQEYLRWIVWIQFSQSIQTMLEEDDPEKQLEKYHHNSHSMASDRVPEEQEACTRIHTTYKMLHVLVEWLSCDKSKIPQSSTIFE